MDSAINQQEIEGPSQLAFVNNDDEELFFPEPEALDNPLLRNVTNSLDSPTDAGHSSEGSDRPGEESIILIEDYTPITHGANQPSSHPSISFPNFLDNNLLVGNVTNSPFSSRNPGHSSHESHTLLAVQETSLLMKPSETAARRSRIHSNFDPSLLSGVGSYSDDNKDRILQSRVPFDGNTSQMSLSSQNNNSTHSLYGRMPASAAGQVKDLLNAVDVMVLHFAQEHSNSLSHTQQSNMFEVRKNLLNTLSAFNQALNPPAPKSFFPRLFSPTQDTTTVGACLMDDLSPKQRHAVLRALNIEATVEDKQALANLITQGITNIKFEDADEDVGYRHCFATDSSACSAPRCTIM